MHALLNILAVTTTTVGKSSKKSSSTLPFLIILVVFFAVYMLFIRPRSQRMRQQQGAAARTLSIGDPVVTAGGIQGRVVAMDDNVAEVEVAPGVVINVLRRSISPRADAPPVSSADTGSPLDDDWPGDHGQLDAPPLASTTHPLDEPGSIDQEHPVDPGDDDPPGDQSAQHP